MKEKVKSADGYVLLFDESLNQELQKKQMDFHVRIWNHNKVETRYMIHNFLDMLVQKIYLESFTPAKRTRALEI